MYIAAVIAAMRFSIPYLERKICFNIIPRLITPINHRFSTLRREDFATVGSG
jgi:hypothetical protein